VQPLAKLEIVEGPGQGEEFEVDQAAILGRLDTNDVPLKDGKASREHAKVYKQGTLFSIVDLNSSNGTFVNGWQVTKQKLESGDEITIGKVTLRFTDPEAEAVQQAALAGRKSLDDDFGKKGKDAPSGGGGAAPGEKIVMTGHEPLQYRKKKRGNPMLGLDLDQVSDGARIFLYAALVVVFAALMYFAYVIVAG